MWLTGPLYFPEHYSLGFLGSSVTKDPSHLGSLKLGDRLCTPARGRASLAVLSVLMALGGVWSEILVGLCWADAPHPGTRAPSMGESFSLTQRLFEPDCLPLLLQEPSIRQC